MMNDLNIPFFRKTMFAGMATLFLSTGVTQANPVSAGEEVTEKHAAALPLQKKVTITGVVKDALGPVIFTFFCVPYPTTTTSSKACESSFSRTVKELFPFTGIAWSI